jgi:hypothetical protein
MLSWASVWFLIGDLLNDLNASQQTRLGKKHDFSINHLWVFHHSSGTSLSCGSVFLSHS